MSGAKTMVKKRNFNETTVEEEPIIMNAEFNPEISLSEDENSEYANILSIIQEIRKNNDIEGYILKGEAKATVDLNDSTKIVEYAMLTSQAFESATSLSASFDVGNIESLLVEGRNIKALCLSLGKNNLGVFMKKNIDEARILDALLTH